MTKYKEIIIIIALVVSGVCGFIVSLYQHSRATTVSSNTVIETFHYPATFVKQLAGDPRAGEKIFKEFCSACHSPQPQIDIKAPHIGDANAWRIPRQLGMEALMKITTRGIGAMPSRGGCFECSDAQLRETIQYMLDYH